MYTYGSAELVTTVGWVGGWGCCFADGWERADYPPPPPSRQTINRAELQAVIEVISHYHDGRLKIAVCTDSAYVDGGLQQGAHGWHANGWVTAQGPVTNVDLWSLLMTLLDTASAVWVWIKVLSHIDIPGNEKADKLAEKGHRASPLYLTVRHPPKPPETPPPPPPAANGNGNGEPASMQHRTIELHSVCESDLLLLTPERANQDCGQD